MDSLNTSLVHAQDRYEYSQKLNNNAFAIISAQATELATQDEQLSKLRKANWRLWVANLIQSAGHLLRR